MTDNTKRRLRCVRCGKALDDGGYTTFNYWLQWSHYSEIGPCAEANCYCSKECFADYWAVEWIDADEFEWGDEDD